MESIEFGGGGEGKEESRRESDRSTAMLRYKPACVVNYRLVVVHDLLRRTRPGGAPFGQVCERRQLGRVVHRTEAWANLAHLNPLTSKLGEFFIDRSTEL